ncbi:MAG TPA: S41 family peptidase [Bacteroidia bacterium]|nr:S41 family peptidase [Bacteroidia bacterium]HQF28860.1 S41 family peptidase [Bacteroidia bacterium]
MLSRLKNSFRRLKLWMIVLLTGTVFLSFKAVDDNYFEISRNLDIYTTILRELSVYYVDPINTEAMVRESIDDMLESLDPYTTFIPESEADDYRFMTTGQYGGIGALIGQRDNDVIITDPYEGFPAQKSGLMAGDVIVSIDGKKTKGLRYDEVSKMLKGSPKTNISIVVARPTLTGSETITKTLSREEIQIKNVPYYGVIENNVGYIRLSSFTDDAGQEVKDAVKELTEKKKVSGLILDLRGNPGGLLNEAINIVNVFVDKGQEVVSTRGKVKDWDKIYKTLNNPVDTKTPLVVLVNSGSASASEIVSGSLQDFDRAAIVGQRTFGKGLVQTTRPLAYNAQLKVTTAKYYIPSGRCIQALDYTHRNPDGSVGKVPDSLMSEFKTKNGRKVYDGGGINPDYTTSIVTYSSIAQTLALKYMYFDYATLYRLKNPTIKPAKDFVLTDAEYNDFISWLNSKEYDYVTDSERQLDILKEKAEKENYYASIKDDYEAVKNKLKSDKNADLQLHKQEIKWLLENEIVSRYYYQDGRTENSFLSDPEIKTAVRALKDPAVYTSIMNRSFKE